MGDVIVLGGYGLAGIHCVRELAETTRSEIVVAGRSIQRAEQVALACGERARGAYANASDRRTLLPLIPGAEIVVACCGGDWTAALEVALESRVPFVGVGPLRLEPRAERHVAALAWQAQMPVVLQTGAVPGVPGLLAEWLVRRHPRIHQLRIASTGPWEGTACARRDVALLRSDPAPVTEFADRHHARARTRATRWTFPEPVGARTLHPARCRDLERFPEMHMVENLVYLEPDPGPLVRGLGWMLGLSAPPGFAAAAEAWLHAGDAAPVERVTLDADDTLAVATALVGTLVNAILQGKVSGGLWTPREALNPTAALEALEKRGCRTTLS